jgi:hypothetical protein
MKGTWKIAEESERCRRTSIVQNADLGKARAVIGCSQDPRAFGYITVGSPGRLC